VGTSARKVLQYGKSTYHHHLYSFVGKMARLCIKTLAQYFGKCQNSKLLTSKTMELVAGKTLCGRAAGVS
jgi:hypothetical protein